MTARDRECLIVYSMCVAVAALLLWQWEPIVRFLAWIGF